MSRIFQSLGASLDDLPALWIAAPLTGLLVQPIIGHYERSHLVAGSGGAGPISSPARCSPRWRCC